MTTAPPLRQHEPLRTADADEGGWTRQPSR